MSAAASCVGQLSGMRWAFGLTRWGWGGAAWQMGIRGSFRDLGVDLYKLLDGKSAQCAAQSLQAIYAASARGDGHVCLLVVK
jgi:hypothetical protein